MYMLEWLQNFVSQKLFGVLDLLYTQHMIWVFFPMIVTFLLPIVLFFFLYLSALFLHIYRMRDLLRDLPRTADYWYSARKFLAALWEAQGKIWHGYEVIGFEKIPSNKPALIIYYHGALPLDFYYFSSKCVLHMDKTVYAVGDKFLFKIPGLKLLMEVFHILPGTVTGGVQLLRDGNLLAIAPGGVREAQFSDENYGLIWGSRTGFASIAIEAKVPIIPMFTQNCREAIRSLGFCKNLLRKLYERTRLPIVPLYGGFPVKLRTYIGNPIPYQPGITAEQLARKVHESVEGLIREHQIIPGSIIKALCDRFSVSSDKQS